MHKKENRIERASWLSEANVARSLGNSTGPEIAICPTRDVCAQSIQVYKIPESFKAFCRIVSFTAANTKRMLVVSVACVKLM